MTTGFPASTALLTAVFLVCLATTVAGALIAVLTTRIIRSVCGLAVCCIGLGGLYYFLGSPFLALMQILIYVGAVCIAIVFAIMLAEPDEPAGGESKPGVRWWTAVGFLAAAALFWGLVQLAVGASWPALGPGAGGKTASLADLGVALLKPFSLAFEVISLVLLVAILGALAVARGGRHHE